MFFSMPQRRLAPLDAFPGVCADADGDVVAVETFGTDPCVFVEGFEAEERMLSNERNIPGGMGWSFLIMTKKRLGAGLHGAVEGAARCCCSASF